MNRLEQTELKRCLEALAKKDIDGRYLAANICDDPDFQALERMANQPREKEGNDTRLQNMTDFTWERLLSMRDEALKLAEEYEKQGQPNTELFEVHNRIYQEIERRLLKILP